MDSRLKKAMYLADNSKVTDAINLLNIVKKDDAFIEQASRLIIKIAFKNQLYQLAKSELEILIKLFPSNFEYCSILIDIHLGEKNLYRVCDIYHEFIKYNGSHSLACYNYAYYLKQIGKFEESLHYYEKALLLNISEPFEVYLNMANICTDHLRDDVRAIELLNKALVIKPNYTAALYNLANIYEQQGNKIDSYKMFRKVYDLEPTNTDALARLCDIKTFTTDAEFEVVELLKILKSKGLEANKECNMQYALGKAFDDCGDYTKAFFHYKKANQLDRQTLPMFNQIDHSNYISALINEFNTSVKTQNTYKSTISPVFICGMFRSGSTLTEQILAAHPEVISGGELEFFHRYITNQKSPFPESVRNMSAIIKQEITQQYESEINLAFKDVKIITDKRPDNILYLGFIKLLYPDAKIVITKRNIWDNCLSVFFLRLGASMNYATALDDIIFYYKEQLRLLEHWKKIYDKDIFILDYDSLVEHPKEITSELLTFIGLDWNDKCAQFYNVKNSVKTASVWQVRQPLYKKSSGRWRNYSEELNQLGIKF